MRPNKQKKSSDSDTFTPVDKWHDFLTHWNTTNTKYPSELTLTKIFENIVKKNKNKEAIISGKLSLTFGELNNRANHLADILTKQGANTHDLVGIMLDRGHEIIISILAILKIGGTYVPIDPGYPTARVKHMLNDSQIRIIITQTEYTEKLYKSSNHIKNILDIKLIPNLSKIILNPIIDNTSTPEDFVYIIYTSGSTGNPKGVPVTHRNICNYVYWFSKNFGLEQHCRIDFSSTISFDFSITSTLVPLLLGACIVICPDEVKYSPVNYLQYLKKNKITHVKWTPGYLNSLLFCPEGIKKLKNLDWIILGGEALSINDIKTWFSIYPKASIVNEYGPTEATVATIAKIVTIDSIALYTKTIPIGQPAANTQIYIVNAQGHLCQPAEHGEIWIAGDSVTMGYYHQPELTNERFITNPFNKKNSSRIYKTGDLAYWRENGDVEYLGRMDTQVKIRGFRVELGEIEAQLTNHPDIQQSVVITNTTHHSTHIIAFVVTRKKSLTIDKKLLYQFLSTTLPEYMLPTTIIQVPQIPMTPHGKIDKNALPRLYLNNNRLIIKARNNTETLVINIISKALNIPETHISIYDNFFEIGGDSLLAMQVIVGCYKHLQKDVSIRLLFETPSILAFCEKLATLKKSASAQEIKVLSKAKNQTAHLASFAQQRIWFLEQLETNSALYNVFLALKLKGSLNIEALHKTLIQLIKRHSSLCTCFIMKHGVLQQKIIPDLDLSINLIIQVDSDITLQNIQSQAHQEAQTPFDLTKAPLLRIRLLRHKKNEHFLFLCLHHIIVDGWSIHILLTELAEIYNAYCQNTYQNLPPLPLRYIDFTHWQQHYFNQVKLQPLLSYWKKQLQDLPQLTLPIEHTHTKITGHKGERLTFKLDSQFTTLLKSFSQKINTTVFTMLLTGFSLLLARYTQQEDIVVGTPTASRNAPELENMIGFFVNLLVLRTDLTNNPNVLTLLQRNKEMILAAFEHQDCPFEKIVELLKPEREISHNPLCPVLFVFQNYPHPMPKFNNIHCSRAFSDNKSVLFSDFESSKFDLTLFIQEENGHFDGLIEYNCDIFKQQFILNLVKHYQSILTSMIHMPNISIWELPIVLKKEQRGLLVNTIHKSNTLKPTLISRFEAQAKLSPECIAIHFQHERLTYHELNIRANQLAHYLRSMGVRHETVVAICLSPGVNVIVALLGILKAGGTYLPIDSEYPTQRVHFMLSDSSANYVLTQKNIIQRLSLANLEHLNLLQWEDELTNQLSQQPIENINPLTNLNSLAYVVYTSGTTGKPKGIAIEEKTISNLVNWQSKQSDRNHKNILQFASIGFDVFLQEVFFTLLNGHSLTIVPQTIKHAIPDLLSFLHISTINQIFIPTVLLDLLAKEAIINNLPLPSLNEIIVAGEQLIITPRIKEFFHHYQHIKLINHYGPSETHVVTSYEMHGNPLHWPELPPIGKPIENTMILILDKNKQLTPVGIIGEIYIGGIGLARGYLNQKHLTEIKFLPHIINNQEIQIYKTGDLGYYAFDGEIHYTGRIDEQIKIRGFRVELNEIESMIMQYPTVEQASVMLNIKQDNHKQLIAYIVPQDKMIPIPIDALRDFLKENLPNYMLPTYFILLDNLPVTTHGKVDKKQLHKLSNKLIVHDTSDTEPLTPIQLSLQRIMADNLNIPEAQIKLDDNFFDLGLHSLLILQIVTKINAHFKTQITIKNLFESSTLNQLSKIVEDDALKPYANLRITEDCVIPLKQKGNRPALFFIHPIVGNIHDYYILSNHLILNLDIYAIQDPSLDEMKCLFMSIEEMAQFYVKKIQNIQPKGPYYLGGYSMGGTIAAEMALQLCIQGESIAWLGLLDTWAFSSEHIKLQKIFQNRMANQYQYFEEKVKNLLDGPHFFKTMYQHHAKLLAQYALKPLNCPIYLFKATETPSDDHATNYWEHQPPFGLHVYHSPGSHNTMLAEPHVKILANQIVHSLQSAP